MEKGNMFITAEDTSDPEYPGFMDGIINLQIIFEHPQYRSMSIYRMVLDSTVPVYELKGDLQSKLRTEPKKQRWFYNGSPIPDNKSLRESGVRSHDKLLVKVNQM